MTDPITCPICGQKNAAENTVCVICRSLLESLPVSRPVTPIEPAIAAASGPVLWHVQVINTAHWLVYGVIISGMLLSMLWFTHHDTIPPLVLYALGILFAALALVNLRAHHRFKIRYARHLKPRVVRTRRLLPLLLFIGVLGVVALALADRTPADPAQHFNIWMALTCGIAGTVGAGIMRRHTWIYHLPRFIALLAGMLILYYVSRLFDDQQMLIFLGLAAINGVIWYALIGRSQITRH